MSSRTRASATSILFSGFMNSKSIVGLAAMSLMLTACQSNSYRIDGFAGMFLEGDTVVLAADAAPDVPIATTLVHNGKFLFSGETDTVGLCTVYQKQLPDQRLTFFLEPGNIAIELNRAPVCSRVSGTIVNNEWQALNDTVTKYDRKLCQLFATDSVNPRKMFAETEKLHTTLTRRINEAAKRNQDNALGRFISSHYPQ